MGAVSMALNYRFSRMELGSIDIEPKEPVFVGYTGTWKIIYTGGLCSLKAGTIIKVTIPLCWSVPKKNKSGPGTLDVSTDAKVSLRTEIIRHRHIYLFVTGGCLEQGDIIFLEYGTRKRGGSGSQVQSALGNGNAKFAVAVDPSGKGRFKSITNSPVIKVLPRCPVHLNVVLPSFCFFGEPVTIKISVVDEYGNPVKRFKGKFEIKSTVSAKMPSSVEINTEGYSCHTISVIFFKSGVARIRLIDTQGNLEAESNPTVVRKRIASQLSDLFWGDIHVHSIISDGLANPDNGYKYARDISHLDFVALTDHDYEAYHSWYDRKEQIILNQDLKKIKNINKRFNAPNKFVTLNGYEWTGRPWGDRCVYFLNDDLDIVRCSDRKGSDPQLLYNSFKGRNDVLIVPHTTCSDFMGGDFNSEGDQLEYVMEIYSMHGSSELEKSSRPVLKSVRGQYYRDALRKGFKFGVVGGGDNHLTQPGNPYLIPGPYSSLRYTPGLTAVYSNELTRNGIFYGLKKKYCYATTGARIVLVFSVNGTKMGEEVKINVGNILKIKVFVAGTDNIALLEIIRAGKVVYSLLNQERDLSFEWEDPDVSKESSYYYVRLIQEDGEMAWSSPVWINIKNQQMTL